MIKFDHVDKIYPNGYKALDDVSLTVNDGDFLCIIGLSGAGKSTLIRTINKMHDIQHGQLIVNDVDISKIKGKKGTEVEIESIEGVKAFVKPLRKLSNI